MIAYPASNNLMPRLQSGFRSGYSTENAILRVFSDIYFSIDQGQVALLALLDVSAAFDTVVHDIILERLSKSFGITGSATSLDQILPHIAYTDCTRGHIYINQRRPSVGASPHGSVLGPLLYVFNTADVAGIVTSFGLGVHLYADDTQLYGICLASDAEALSRLSSFPSRQFVCGWQQIGFDSRLNPDKTQFIWSVRGNNSRSELRSNLFGVANSSVRYTRQ